MCRKYDEDGGLSAAEIFVYEGNRIITVSFNLFGDGDADTVTESIYEDSLLKRFTWCHVTCYQKAVPCAVEIKEEIFEYRDGLMSSLLYSNYYWDGSSRRNDLAWLNDDFLRMVSQNFGEKTLHIHQRYTFTRDAEGYLSSFVIEDLEKGPYESSASVDPRTYPVEVRRK